MVKQVLAVMNKEIRGLHEAAYLLAAFTFLAQLLSLVRDRVFAHFFGAGPTLDAYFAAFRIPDFTFAFLTLFVSSFALIPLLERHGGAATDSARRLIGSTLAAFGVVSIILSLALYALLPHLVPFLFGGFSEAAQAQTVALSGIMLLQPLLLGLSSVMTSVVQSSRKFVLYALAPVFYNIGIIIGALFLYPSLGITGLAWGVVLGALLHLSVQVIPVALSGSAHLPLFDGAWFADIKSVAMLSAPRALALGANQLVLLAFAVAGSLAVAGSVSVLMFGFNLQSVPLAVIGVSYASALFPSLSALFEKGDRETFAKEVWTAVRHITLWTMLAIALMVVLRAHIVRVILGSGAFTWADTRLTAAILAGFVISLVAQATILIFSRAYYAAGRSFEPIAVNVGAALFASAASVVALLWFKGASLTRYFFEDLFRVADIPGTEVVMLALAYSAVMLTAALVFAILYGRRFGFDRGALKSMFFSFAAAVIAAFSTYGTLQLFGPLLPTDTFLGIFAQGAAGATFGVLSWAVTLTVIKSEDFAEVRSVVSRILKDRSTVA